MSCAYCDTPSQGGVSTNFDPYGTRKKIGLPVEKWQSICWNCWDEKGAAKDSQIRKETTQAVLDRGSCGFLEAWIGHCLNSRPCREHENKTCWECGKPAVQNCAMTGSLVCGIPECLDHPHVHERSA
jgi:hypothetical protein